MSCKGIAGIVLMAIMAIMVAFITVGITAVEATAEEPFSIEDCPNCPDSGMVLYNRHYSLWILRCNYHNVVDSRENSGVIHIFAFTNADDTENRFKRMRNDDLKTAERHYSNTYKILRNNETEFVWIFTSVPGIISQDEIYNIIGYFLYAEENRMTKVSIGAASKDEKIAIMRFDALAKCAKSVIDKKCGEKKEEIDLVIQEKHEWWIDKATGTYNVSYTIKNIGDGTVSAGHSTSLFVDGVQEETRIVPVALKPKGIYRDTFKKLLTVSEENDTIKVCGDCNEEVKESDDTNNCRGNVWEAPPDLVVLEIKRKQVDKVFGKYKLEYDIKNIGKGTASAGHNTSLFVDDVLNETKAVPVDLKPNGIYTDTFDTNIKRSGESDTIKVCVDHNNDVEESKEPNNCKEKVWEALLKVNVTLPAKNYVVQKGEKVDIVASVKDDLNNMVNGSNIDPAVASFTTKKNKIDTNMHLYDDGKHHDGGKDDGVYANTWTPTKTGDCTITVTAKKTDFKDGVDKVNGSIIAKPVLEIPALFKNVHPYRNERGEDAPVFQRGIENPQFKITNLTGTKPSGVKLIIDISEPQIGGGFRIVKNLNVTQSWSATPILVDWDWSDNSGPRKPSNIPVGIYKAKAKLINSSTNRLLKESDEKEFYVIFDWDNNRRNFITTDFACIISIYPAWSGTMGEIKFKLHQYDHRIWRDILGEINGNVTMKNALNGIMAKVKGQITYKGEINHKDTIPLLTPSVQGNCMDQSSLMIAYCRAIGIPARSISASGTSQPDKYNLRGYVGGIRYIGTSPEYLHQWLEVSVNGNWYHYDPTQNVNSYGEKGSQYYARQGYVFNGKFPKNKGYWVVTSRTSPGVNLQNVYKKYTYVAEIVDPPGWNKTDYDYGDPVQVDVTVRNTGEITISTAQSIFLVI